MRWEASMGIALYEGLCLDASRMKKIPNLKFAHHLLCGDCGKDILKGSQRRVCHLKRVDVTYTCLGSCSNVASKQSIYAVVHSDQSMSVPQRACDQRNCSHYRALCFSSWTDVQERRQALREQEEDGVEAVIKAMESS